MRRALDEPGGCQALTFYAMMRSDVGVRPSLTGMVLHDD